MADPNLQLYSADKPNGIISTSMGDGSSLVGGTYSGQTVQGTKSSSNINPNGLSTSTAGTAGYQTAGYQTVDPYLRSVDAPTETVQGQLTGIIDAGSPLMERARARALEQANSRGLLNSSMAVGAGESALYDHALQIATPDAATYTQASRDNQGVKNQVAQFNAGSFNQNQQFNAGAFNDAERTNLTEGGATERSNVQQSNELNRTNITEAGATARANAQNATTLQATQMSNENRIQVAQLDAANRVALQDMESKNRLLIQGNASATELYKNTQDQIGAIQRDPTLDEGAKKAAILQIIEGAEAGMTIVTAASGVKLDGAIDWEKAKAPFKKTEATEDGASPAASPSPSPASAPSVPSMYDRA